MVSSIAVTGTNSAEFSQTNNCGTTVGTGGSCSISVTFTPAAPGSRSATVSVTDNAAASPQVATLTGSGIGPAVTLSPTSVTFPSQYVGTSGLPQNVTLTNTGAAPLAITSVIAAPADFAPLSTCGSSVAVGSSCSIGVFFDPTATGTRTGTLTVTDNAGDSPQSLSLSGTGQDFSMASSGSSTATISAGQTATFTILVAPGGGFAQTVSFTCSGAPLMSACSVSPSSVALTGLAPQSVSVKLTTTGTSARRISTSSSTDGKRSALWLPAFGLPFLMLVGIWGTASQERRDRIGYFFALVCLVSASIAMSACGGSSAPGGGNGGGTPSGTYNLSVTGSFASGSTTLTHIQKFTVTVQ